RRLGARERQSRFTAANALNSKAGAGEGAGGEFAGVRLILNNDHERGVFVALHVVDLGGGAESDRGISQVDGDVQGEGGAFTQGAFHCDVATEQLRETPRDGEAEA